MTDQIFSVLKPKIVLGVAAHPDDLDFGASGTMANFAKNGAQVYYLILTDGSQGTEDKNITPQELSKIRHKEQEEALKILGGQSVTFLDYPDGGLEVTLGLKKEIVREIRRIKPDVVVTMDPSMLYSAQRGFINHPDHRAAGQATLDAVFPLARDHLAFPELFKAGYLPHKTKTVLLTNFEKSNYYVDTTDTFELKVQALKAHKSQIKDIDEVRAWTKLMAQTIGSQAGYNLAEGFIRIDLRN
jgi:LmbE family N-acetylglucosaminyl deacetylase